MAAFTTGRGIKVRVCLAMVALLTLASAAATTSASGAQEASGTVTIASVLSLTGPASAFGILAQEGIQTAVAYVNSHGGIDGRKVIYKSYDDQTSATQAAALVQQVASDSSVLGIIGPSTAATGTAGAIAANNLHVPMISLTGDAEGTYPGDYVFKTAATFKQHAEAVLRFCKSSLKHGIIGVEYQSNGYGNVVAQYMSQEAAAYGVKVILQGVDPTSTDVTSAYQKLIQAKANVIVSVHTTNVAASINDYKSIGTKVPLVETIVASNPLSIAGADQALVGTPVLAYFSGDTAQKRQIVFERYFRSRTHKDAYYNNATGWDALQLYARAIKGQKSPTRDSVRLALEKQPLYVGAAGLIKFAKGNHQGFAPAGFEWLLYTGHGKFKFLTSGTTPKPVKLG
jgi:branched-chain amino acid transport system substrate-binding protein